jgi:hypothetical protein
LLVFRLQCIGILHPSYYLRMNQSSSSSFQVAICLNIEDVLWGWFNQIVLHIHLVLLGSTLVAVGVLVWQYVQNRVALHGNLLVHSLKSQPLQLIFNNF